MAMFLFLLLFVIRIGTDNTHRNTRVETVFLFAQSVYLMFSSEYVFKETIEYFLLFADAAGAGGGEGYHHHGGDEDELPIEFPIVMILITLLYVLCDGCYV
ncbi:hypothetical protein BDQ17DRAFT_460964 [Cyathus striatus]|nr:hypothetical protein BDQ17DRAFT_460964 [Cyathus striatus]